MTIGIDGLGTFYTRDADGLYTVVLASDVPVTLVQIRNTAQTMEGRREMTQGRRLLWDPSLELPKFVQVEIDGERWNIVEGPAAKPRGPSGGVYHRSTDVVRASS